MTEKKPARNKPVSKAAKKSAAKKMSVKKPAAKTPAKKTPAKKVAAKKPAAKAPVKKAPAKKPSPKAAKPPIKPAEAVTPVPPATEMEVAIEPLPYKIIPEERFEPDEPSLSPFHPISLLATWFGAGTASYAPGTAGSIAALPFAWLIQTYLGDQALLLAAFIAFLGGVWICDQYMARNKTGHDPREIVIDEVAGMWLILVAMPATWQGYLLGFALFRLFDIWKPWPIRRADRTIQGGVGVMFDDLLAAVIPGILLAVLTFILLITGNGEVIERAMGYLAP